MGIFSNKADAQAELETLNKNIEKLLLNVEELKAEQKSLAEVTAMTKERDLLKKQITDLEISKSKLVEDNDRKQRETEHKVGLLIKQNEQDAEHAKRMAQLEVREGNLAHEKTVFDAQMKFREEQFDNQFQVLHGLTAKILEHLPNVNYDITEDRTRALPEIAASDGPKAGDAVSTEELGKEVKATRGTTSRTSGRRRAT